MDFLGSQILNRRKHIIVSCLFMGGHTHMRTHVHVYIEEDVNVCCLSQLFCTLFFETGSHTIWSSPIQPHSWSISPRDPLSLLPQCWVNKHNCTNVSVFHPKQGCWDAEAQVLMLAPQVLY